MNSLTGREIDSILLTSTDDDKERRYSRAAVMASCRLVYALTRRNPNASFEDIHAEITRIFSLGRFPHALRDIQEATKQ